MADHTNKMTRNDQAAGLRRLMAKPKPRVISILSDSASQTKSHLITNLAVSMISQGTEVLVMHASDNVLERYYELDKSPTLLDVLLEKTTLAQAIKLTSHGFSSAKLFNKNALMKANNEHTNSQLNLIFNQLVHQYDIILVDTMLNKNNVLPLNQLNACEIIIQLSRKPEAITQGYSLIKQICNELGRRSFGIIVEDSTEAQARVVFNNISQVAERFMQIELEFFGAIPVDSHINRASKLGRSVIDAFPLTIASTALKQIAQRLDYKHDGIFNKKQAQLS